MVSLNALQPEPPSRSCVLVGEGNVLIGSGELLLNAGLLINGVISDDPSVARWAHSRGFPITGHGPETVDWLRRLAHDYLLSVFNLRIIPPEMIGLPRIAALNYHDALLPRYAGLHATSWALINGEKTHGITWHILEAGIDTGAIVRQRAVAVTDDETALSLNVKCSAAALAALADMVPDLLSGVISVEPQDLSSRTYCAGSKRPSVGGILDWRRPSEEIDALLRGCDFGVYFNPLVLPKLWTGAECLIVAKASGGERSAAAAQPGTILTMTDDALTVATPSGAVAVGELMTIDGEPLPIVEAAQRYGLRIGQLLPEMTSEQSEQLTDLTELLAPHERFWQGRLENLIPAMPFRSSALSGADDSCEKVRQVWRLPDEVDGWLASHQWNRAEFLLAACGAFLGKLSFQDTFDVEFARADIEPDVLPTLFARRVPFRFEVGDEIESLVTGVRAELARIARHRTYPRDLVPRSPGLRGQPDLCRSAKIPVAVELGFAAHTDELVIFLPPEGGAGLAERFADFVRNLVSHEGALCRISLVNRAEQAVLNTWGRGADGVKSEDCLHHLFESQAARTPEAIAVRSGVSTMTYRDLDDAANRLADRLCKQGVGPEVRVGVYLARSTELIVAVLGILKAGGTYVPLDPAYPPRRLDFIANDCGLKTIVTVRRYEPMLCGGQISEVYLDDDHEPPTDITIREPVPVTNRACAYVIYTSGSTGEPKGVQVEHRSAVNLTRAAQTRYRLTQQDRVLQFASISFDASVEEIFPCLSSGATLVLRTDDMLSSAKEFMGRCAEFGITVLDLPTAYWHTLVSTLIRTGPAGYPDLRLVIIGGETAIPGSVAAWDHLVGPDIELINTYGPTEATVVSTWADIGNRATGHLAPIGTPIPGTTAEVLDRWGQLVPVGVPGELHIGGVGVARGYLNRPVLTAEKFLSDPTGTTSEARLFRTGDLCSWRTDGMLEFHGRIDDQVKLRGYRIELGEIEAVLRDHPEVADAAVVVRDRDILRACIVPRASSVNWLQLREDLRATLPDWMVPGELLLFAKLPTSANGKVDRSALAEADRATTVARTGEASGDGANGPRTLLEMEIIRIWRGLFGREDIHRDDNFFDLGGHSLMAVQFLDELEHRIGRSVSITTLFQTQTVGSLSRALTNSSSMPAWTSLVPLQPNGNRRPLFVIHGLKGVVFAFVEFARLISPDQPVYGLQGVGIDDDAPRHTTTRDMASHYIREIRGLQPEGPYLLAGFSLGGWIAYEMAAQLRGAGQQVTIFVFDSHPVCSVPWRGRGAFALVKISIALCGARNHLPRLASLRIRQWPRYVAQKVRKLLAGLLGPSGQKTPLSAQSGPVNFTSLGEPAEDYYAAVLRRHSQGVSDVRVELFLATEPLAPRLLHASQTLLWRLLARGGLHVHMLSCNHSDILSNPHVAGLAEIVDRVLVTEP